MTARVLVACEFSGTVREAFLARGYDAWSCDIIPDEQASDRHIQCDVRDILNDGWDLLIAHPPCTRLCLSGLRWLHKPPARRTLEDMWAELDDSADLFSSLWNAPIERIAVENPKMHRHAKERIKGYIDPTQIVQPWQYGRGETKATGLWLKNLPLLSPTEIVDGRLLQTYRMAQTLNRQRERQRTIPGLAAAMADQWGPTLSRDLTPPVKSTTLVVVENRTLVDDMQHGVDPANVRFAPYMATGLGRFDRVFVRWPSQEWFQQNTPQDRFQDWVRSIEFKSIAAAEFHYF